MDGSNITINKRSNDGLIVFLPGSWDGGDLLQEIEQRLDDALSPVGFTRTGEDKDDAGVTLHYFQFAYAL